jgi:hypothetical protein
MEGWMGLWTTYSIMDDLFKDVGGFDVDVFGLHFECQRE